MTSLGGKAAAVVFERVTKAFGPVVAVRDVSFAIEPGALVTLLGPSGCGKTTTLRLIAGLERPSAGRILIGDEDVTTLPATERDVSMVFQSYALFPHMTVLENVAYGLTVSGRPKAEARARAEDGLALVGLAGYGKRLPSELSGGQQQRVAVARALVLEPEVLLFDEPLSNLDAKLRRRVREEIRELQQKLGLTSVYVTHDQGEALAVSDRIIVMRDAEIAQAGSPRELYDQPLDLFVADFIGDANLIEAEITAVNGALATVRIGPLTRALPHRGLAPGPAHVALRPETIRLVPEARPDAIAGEVTKATYLGSHMEYTVSTAEGDLFVIDQEVERALRPGTAVSVVPAGRGITLVRD
jgi:iron(III) transport system ATP-binding protein